MRLRTRQLLAVTGTALATAVALGAPSQAVAAGRGEPARVTCAAATTKVTVTPVKSPVNHLLITVKNTGKTLCDAYYAPALRFDDAQAATTVNRDSQPQAVVSLMPGESAYAGVTTSAADGSGTHGYTAHRLEVHFVNRTDTGSVGAPAKPALPKAGVWVDSSAQVTYWQYTAADALMW
ncbi:DUF4232 domain-containing protein [Streptomyces sp. LP05-1]|uniref:DUF4232 domain-containing protein n=1 Tax=Streptomyces pyxinae TaxID=2970734 RepID=A0ABT2CE35_9ACTN|nr:DUF4232 domain-containing protein [Streptomyces sp. LP05-1]MCS0635660.1 DUF4232 domain-containing protein [Streptomyces sp. LP05-1]